MRERSIPLPTVVTSEFHVMLKRPTPMDTEVMVVARPSRIETASVTVDAEIRAHGKVTATCRGVFVVVKAADPTNRRPS